MKLEIQCDGIEVNESMDSDIKEIIDYGECIAIYETVLGTA